MRTKALSDLQQKTMLAWTEAGVPLPTILIEPGRYRYCEEVVRKLMANGNDPFDCVTADMPSHERHEVLTVAKILGRLTGRPARKETVQ